MTMKRLTPFLPVRDVSTSVQFYEDVLGFHCAASHDGYAYLKRDDIALRVVRASADKNMGSSDSQVHCYIDVNDADALFAELEGQLSELPEGRVRPPFDTSYGQREFHVIDADVTLISFGSPQRHLRKSPC